MEGEDDLRIQKRSKEECGMQSPVPVRCWNGETGEFLLPFHTHILVLGIQINMKRNETLTLRKRDD